MFAYKVLISENWQGDRWVAWRGDGEYFTLVSDHKGINIFILRHKVGHPAVAQLANSWFDASSPKIIDYLFSHDILIGNLSELIADLIGVVGSLVDSLRFRSVVILHNSKYFASDCVINYGITNMTVSPYNFPATRTIEYFEPHHLEQFNAEKFYFFFFL